MVDPGAVNSTEQAVAISFGNALTQYQVVDESEPLSDEEFEKAFQQVQVSDLNELDIEKSREA